MPDEKNNVEQSVVKPTPGFSSPNGPTKSPAQHGERGSDIPRGWTQFAINLIPSELSIEGNERLHRRLIVGITLVVLAVVVSGAYVSSIWWQLRISRAAIDKTWLSVDSIQTTLDQQQRQIQDLVVMNNQLGALEKVLDRHVYWTNFFDFLERTTIDDVSYTNFSMTGTERVVLAAVGKDYTSVARQLESFRNETDVVVSAETTGVTADIGPGGEYLQTVFTISLTVRPDLFTTPPGQSESPTL